jgi:hypothetical protein
MFQKGSRAYVPPKRPKSATIQITASAYVYASRSAIFTVREKVDITRWKAAGWAPEMVWRWWQREQSLHYRRSSPQLTTSFSEFSSSFLASWTLLHFRSLVRRNLWIGAADSSVSSLLFLARTGFTEHPCSAVQCSLPWTEGLLPYETLLLTSFFYSVTKPICPEGEFARNLIWACTAQNNDVPLST